MGQPIPSTPNMKATRQGFGQGLVELGALYPNVVVLGADVTGSVLTSLFQAKFPERFFSIGVAEQNATTIAVGLALSGKIPFFAGYGAFTTMRNADQLRISVCYNEANVKIAGSHSGVTVGPDGATHQVLEDMALIRALPNLTVVVPCDYEETRRATIAIGEMHGPAYLRFSRDISPMFTTPDTPFQIGRAEVFRDGQDVALIACGLLVWEALQAAQELERRHGIQARVINCHTLKPLDVATIVCAARDCGAIVTAEEHQVHGGLGGAIAEAVVKNYPVPVELVGMKDMFGGSGEGKELLRHFGMTWREIYASALVAIQRRDGRFTAASVRAVKDVVPYSDTL
ncbi:MAG: transketolase C-terminal domain-containing protein [Bacteroidota bacterium]|nr:transketolase family protein [Candidatus Kapabacteria bacterium]MDW8220770.1 transketolase C-terminal domain-containing protein [Bacteroidota bacterium]